MRFVAWFDIAVGVAIAGLWTMLLATRQIPEIAEGRTDIWFHITAELVTAALLVTGGLVVLVSGSEVSELVAAVAAGALLYTTINSPGYYADRGQWPVVIMFAALATATAATVVVLLLSRGD